jgi:uncharacterized protein YjdB
VWLIKRENDKAGIYNNISPRDLVILETINNINTNYLHKFLG